MAAERKLDKETLVLSKMEEEMQAQKAKDNKSAAKEAKKRVKAKRQSIIIERSDSGSSSEDDIKDARVYTVRKSRNNVEEAAPTKAMPAPVEDPLSGMYNQFFLGTRTIL